MMYVYEHFALRPRIYCVTWIEREGEERKEGRKNTNSFLCSYILFDEWLDYEWKHLPTHSRTHSDMQCILLYDAW